LLISALRFFWLPETSDAKTPGILTVSDGGKVKLETIGLLAVVKNPFGYAPTYERIAGEVEKLE
jgi:hypothetical protein